MRRSDNPFRVTKSNDFTDEQIEQLWVTADGDDGVTGLTRPDLPMSMFVLGGKGSGKSHLMRYYSFPVQTLRYQKRGIGLGHGLASDGYIGIYARCGGLDSHRFEGKGQPEEKWADLFAYYFELWVADKTLSALEKLVLAGDISPDREQQIANDISNLLDRQIEDFGSITQVRECFSGLRKELDYAVNNAAITNRVEVEILTSRGSLFFGVPKSVCTHVPTLGNVVFVYMLDEFENFIAPRQIYINTLLREKEGPTSFKIGSRLYGVRTRATLSGSELNIQDAEYEELRLDERFRKNPEAYRRFCVQLLSRRLGITHDDLEINQRHFAHYFEEPDLAWNSASLRALFAANSLRPHLVNLRRKLEKGLKEGLVVGVKDEAAFSEIFHSVTFPEHPLIEKLCILYLFQRWARSQDLLEAASYVSEKAVRFIEGARDERFAEFVDKHKGDMIAQLFRENGQKQFYAGLGSFIRMSEGLPRAFITILKHVYDWSKYMGEDPFGKGQISLRAQQRGTTEAAELFLEQMLMEGHDGLRVRSAIDRLSEVFRVNRFADKPVETSLVAFSVDSLNMSLEARRIMDLALNTSLLVNVSGGQRERNSMEVTRKLELNLMMAPRWDLPIARRGVATLSANDANSIFTYEHKAEFEKLVKSWQEKTSAPVFGRTKGSNSQVDVQSDLFE